MIPLVDDTVLQSNPEFATLHKALTTAILNSDGSTRTDLGAKGRSSSLQDLKSTRLQAAKKHLLARSLATAAPSENPCTATTSPHRSKSSTRRAGYPTSTASDSNTSAELSDVLLLLPSFLFVTEEEKHGSTGLSIASAEITGLLLSSISSANVFEQSTQLARLASEDLRGSAFGLARVANSTTNPSYVHRTMPSLPGQIATLQQSVKKHSMKLAAARQTTLTACISLLEHQAMVVTGLLRSLEAKHGPIARSLELRSSEVVLATQTHMLDAQQISDLALRAIYLPEASDALRIYHCHLRDSKLRLQEAIRERQSMLQEYGVSVDRDASGRNMDKGMREMAKAYSQIGKQVQDIKEDLARLNSRS